MNLNCGLPKSPICVSATTTSVRNSQIFDGQTTIFAGESSKIMLENGVLLIDSETPATYLLVDTQPQATCGSSAHSNWFQSPHPWQNFGS